MSLKEELKQFGLTENEATIYLALYELCEATATPIRRKADLHTSRVYEALNSLIEKGMVSYYMKNNVKHFKAESPDVMFDILDAKRERLLKLAPEIKILKSKKKSEYGVSLYEGYKAIKQLYDHILFPLGPKDEILVLGAHKESEHFLGRTLFRQYTNRRVEKKVKMRMIFNHVARKTAKFYANLTHTEVRLLPKGTVAATPMNIYPDRVSVLILKEKPLVFQLDCKEIAESYKAYFEFLWSGSEPM